MEGKQYGNYIYQTKPIDTYRDLYSELKSLLEESINWKLLLDKDIFNDIIIKQIKKDFKKGSCDCHKEYRDKKTFIYQLRSDFYLYKDREDYKRSISLILLDDFPSMNNIEFDRFLKIFNILK